MQRPKSLGKGIKMPDFCKIIALGTVLRHQKIQTRANLLLTETVSSPWIDILGAVRGLFFGVAPIL
ncbi:hypothetical protein MNBD_ALPHA11-1791 [hydrothermal vent metagenome]|uniref:Uncharacterized protein n=1 Tax=hydrothermal vent metagenome TaxID=652676 RepID=A0A3B0U3X9_9ZZZZ